MPKYVEIDINKEFREEPPGERPGKKWKLVQSQDFGQFWMKSSTLKKLEEHYKKWFDGGGMKNPKSFQLYKLGTVIAKESGKYYARGCWIMPAPMELEDTPPVVIIDQLQGISNA